ELAEVAAARTPPDRTAARWRRRLDAGAFLFRAGDTARARRDLESLAEEMPASAARAEALLILADVLLHDEGEQAAVCLLEEALEQAGADRILQARIHIGIAWACDFDLSCSASHAEAGLALAQQAGDSELTAKALVHKMRADFWLGRGLDL